jgi:hypothetical protein
MRFTKNIDFLIDLCYDVFEVFKMCKLTIDEIHEIRRKNSEAVKDLSPKEKIAWTKARAASIIKLAKSLQAAK